MNFDEFDLDLEPNSRVVVAMSGGVDSSVVACILKFLQYEVIGITLKLYDAGSCSTQNRCCADRDIQDARNVCEKIGIPHYIMNYQSQFSSSVIDYFVDSYANGHTPLPCVKCNQSVKFVDLISCAKRLGAKALATGHYIKRIVINNRPEMHIASDLSKDQSYFLFGTTQDQLKFLRFPLGETNKSMTREYASYFDIHIASKPDSQDICFVPNGDYVDFITKIKPELKKTGEIKDISGNAIGSHQGTIGYTIGQRRGIGVNSNKPMFVLKIDTSKNEIVVGDKVHLRRKFIQINEINLLDDISNILKNKITVKIRSTHTPIHARVYAIQMKNHTDIIDTDYISEDIFDDAKKEDIHAIVIILDDYEYGVAQGQACVMYHESKVLGGGWIIHSW